MSENIIDSLSLMSDPRSPLAVGIGGRNTDMKIEYQYNRPPISRRNIRKGRLIVRGIGSCCSYCQCVCTEAKTGLQTCLCVEFHRFFSRETKGL